MYSQGVQLTVSYTKYKNKMLLLLCLFSMKILQAQSQPAGEYDEATIVLAGDLNTQQKLQLLQAIEGAPLQGNSYDQDSYVLVPGNATVIVITPQDVYSENNELLPAQQGQLTEYQPVQSSPSQGLEPLVQENCTDIPPDNQYSCSRQAAFGKCNADFMLKDNFCAATCKRCSPASPNLGGAMEASSGECVPLSILLLSRNDTQSFRDAVKTVGLERLFGDQDYTATVFIPNDNAFHEVLEKLGATAPQLSHISALTDLIKGHIVPNMAVSTEKLINDQPLIPLSGIGFWEVKIFDSIVHLLGSQLGQATVVDPNNQACNIIAHVIDRVLVN
eukprot:TRINITY_DN5689_c2_g1_i1.p1 TRINITY_DN5689_c2_g1~~TRINITY_DN5689_c2_g1_i1.p1  ORF type:complete len:332 (-),score=19.31 TRINITY_DN5689_c2_g1_i1:359-1354(-)